MKQIEQLKLMKTRLERDLESINRAIQLLESSLYDSVPLHNASEHPISSIEEKATTESSLQESKAQDEDIFGDGFLGYPSAIKLMMKDQGPHHKFTINTVFKYLQSVYPNEGIKKTSIGGSLSRLKKTGHVKMIRPKAGRKPAVYMRGPAPLDDEFTTLSESGGGDS